MAYNIYKADGSVVVVNDNAIDQQFNGTGTAAGKAIGIQLNGRNAIDYGAPTAQTLLQLTENFSGTLFPSDATALQGQLWFEKTSPTTGNLNVRITSNLSGGIANWQRLVTTSSTETGTVPIVNPSGTPKNGDIQVLAGPTINIWASGAWQQIFPAIYS
jgi:hypothetical protein